MTTLKIGVVGAAGRMGQEIADAIKKNNHLPFVGFYRSKRPEKYSNQISDWNELLLKEVDVWIDFSLAEEFQQTIEKLSQFNKPIVSGTTGINDTDRNLLIKISQKIPVLWSSNMSFGVAFINQLLKEFGKIKNFDFQIEEFHHNKKKDAPSGTAKTLKLSLDQAVKKETPAVLSARGGGIFGIHKIWAMSEQEIITLEHQALSRQVFAEGAVRAAELIMKKPPGMYSIDDLL